jgi:hypothetical protein
MTAISRLSWTGIAREATAGTAIATPTLYVPTKSKFQQKTKYVYLDEERHTRDGNNRRVGTVRMASGSLQGAVYLDTIPYLLLGFMGAVTSTQPDVVNAPTAYSHALALADVPPAMTLFKGYDHSGYYFTYSVVNKLKFKWAADGKVFEYDAGTESQYGQKISGGSFSAMTPSYTTDTAFGGYSPTIKIDNVQTSLVEEMEIDLEQKTTLFYTSRGNRAFYKVDYGERIAKATFTARFDDAAFMDDFDAEDDHALNVKFTGNNFYTAIDEEVVLDFPIFGYDDMEVDTSKDGILVKAACTMRPGTTKDSLFTATVVNTIASYAS